MKIFSLLQTRYNQLNAALKEYLSKSLPGYDSHYNNNTIFGQLINVLSAAVQNVMLYIEDAMVEQNKYTAQRKKSIYGLAAQSGYMPHLGKAASVQLAVNYIPNNAKSTDIIINNHEPVICNQNGMIYNIVLPQEVVILSLNRDNSTRYIQAVQGRFETQNFISTGGKYYTQNFNFVGNLDTDYLKVMINNKKWDYVASIYDMTPYGEQWTYKISPVSGIDIVFGNGCYGKPLENGDGIEVSYLLHDGESGNLDINQNTYFLFNNILTDVNGNDIDGNTIFNISLATKDAVSSGSNSESIDQVRQMIGLNSRSLVLASPENYKNFLSKFSFCGYNRTWSEKGSLVVNSLIMKNFKSIINENKTYFDLEEQDFKLTDNQKASILNCINNSGHQLAGVSYNIFDPELCKYAMYIYIKLKPGDCEKDYISNKIRNLVADFFSNINSDIFIPKSDIIHLIKNNIPEIDGVDVYILSERNETAMQKGEYTNTIYKYDVSTGQYNKKTEKVYLYDGENPNIGFDNHGNIYLQSDEQFPVLMGGWDYINNMGDEVVISDPLIIVYE